MTIPSLKYWPSVTHADKHVTEPFPADIIQIANDLQTLASDDQQVIIEALAVDGADAAQITSLRNHRRVKG